MKFKKGSKVEVLCKKEVPSGAWRCGEIISGNGHNYDVRYDWYAGASGTAIVERVSRKQIRPCPPPVGGAVDWVPGDLVEVFDNAFWKIASVLEVMGGCSFLVKLFGSSQELRVHESYLRVRQTWKHDRWVVVGKGSVITEDGQSNKLSTSRFCPKSTGRVPVTFTEMKLPEGDTCIHVEKNLGFQESHLVSSRALKRSLPHTASNGGYTKAGKKLRAIENDGKRQQLVRDYSSPWLEKVDAVASPQFVLGEKYMHASFNEKSGFSEMDKERAQPNNDVGCAFERIIEPNDADSREESVGSCSSTNNNPFRFPCRSLADLRHDSGDHLSDAESFCGREEYEKVYPLPTKEELEAEIHKLELHAYRCTMRALFASGSLSWEQEELVTNLRITLHISNDEHLMELRNLFSAETNMQIS